MNFRLPANRSIVLERLSRTLEPCFLARSAFASLQPTEPDCPSVRVSVRPDGSPKWAPLKLYLPNGSAGREVPL